jgi:hypothetical protein
MCVTAHIIVYAFQSIMNNILFITVHKGIIHPVQCNLYVHCNDMPD